jgi:hypothetical protein
MVLNKYAAAILQIAITVIGGFSIIPADQVTSAAAWGLVALAAQAIITYLVPLVKGAWEAALKTGMSALIALLTVIIPFIGQGHLTPFQWSIAALAALNTVAAELGVAVRKDTATLVATPRNEVVNKPADVLPDDDGLINQG